MIAYNDPHTRHYYICVLVLRPVVEARLGVWHSQQGTCICVLILRFTIFVSSTTCCYICVLIMHSYCICPHTTYNYIGVLILHATVCVRLDNSMLHTRCCILAMYVLVLHTCICGRILHTTIYVSAYYMLLYMSSYSYYYVCVAGRMEGVKSRGLPLLIFAATFSICTLVLVSKYFCSHSGKRPLDLWTP